MNLPPNIRLRATRAAVFLAGGLLACFAIVSLLSARWGAAPLWVGIPAVVAALLCGDLAERMWLRWIADDRISSQR
jgi:hypothetical protein